MEKRIKLCNIYNTPSHYRRSVYKLLDETFDSKFVFGDAAPSVKRFDVKILNDASILKYRYIGNLCFMPGMLKYLFLDFNTYIITPETNNISMWLFLICAKLFPSKKVYTWTHGMYGYESKRQLAFKRMLYNLTNGEFIYGEYAYKLMVQKGFDSKRLFVVHNSLDYDAQLMLRNENLLSDVYRSHFRNNNPIIVSIGRLNKRKRLTMLVEAINLLNKYNLPCNIVIIGEGEDKVILEEKARLLGVEQQVWLYGACYDERRNAELLYNSDICIIPGDIGLTAIHSLMFGVPVITHNDFPHQGPEFEVVKPGQTGNFFEHDNVSSLVSCIENWLKCKKDRDEIRKACYNVIDSEWNPNYQLRVIKNVLNNNLK